MSQNDGYQLSLAAEARTALQAFLISYSWDSLVTATFARKVYHPRQALSLVAPRLHLPALGRAFLAAERFYLGGYHVHGLVAWRGDTTGRPDGDSWAHAAASLRKLGWSRTEGLRNIGGASGYCAKYLTKESELDYDFYGDAGWLAMED